MQRKKKKLAVFDVDGTLFRSSLFIELVERLIATGDLPKTMSRAYERKKREWLNREGEYDAYVAAMVKASEVYFKHVPVDAFRAAARHVVNQQSKHVYRYTRELIKTLKRKNYFLLAVSHSPKVILDYFGEKAGFDKVYGIIYEVGKNNKLTGTIIDEPVILNKANIVKRAVKNQSLTLKGSIGVGDSESDIPFLSLVEKPICFNPSLGLYRRARRSTWKIVVERKNVIYHV